MYRFLRQLHKVFGLALATFLLLLAVTGIILSKKADWAWVRPASAKSEHAIADSRKSVAELLAAAALHQPSHFAADKLARVEIHPDKGTLKILSSVDYQEVQICATTGAVLASGQRFDQMAEHIHDLRFFNEGLTGYFLPWVGVGLACLAISGVVMYATPVFRRWKFKKRPPAA